MALIYPLFGPIKSFQLAFFSFYKFSVFGVSRTLIPLYRHINDLRCTIYFCYYQIIAATCVMRVIIEQKISFLHIYLRKKLCVFSLFNKYILLCVGKEPSYKCNCGEE